MPKSGEPKQHVPVFVGSTFEDLKDYRTAVREALHRLETIVKGMEYFGSKPGDSQGGVSQSGTIMQSVHRHFRHALWEY